MAKTILWPFNITSVGIPQTTEDEFEAIDSAIRMILSLREYEMLGSVNMFSRLNLLMFETNKYVLDAMFRFYVEEAIGKYLSHIVRIIDITGEKDDKKYTGYITYEVKTSEKRNTLPINILLRG